MEGSIESRALRRSELVLKICVDVDSLVPQLYSNWLLTPEEKTSALLRGLSDDERKEALFRSLERRVSADAKYFHELMNVLRCSPAMEVVADRMQG